MAEEKVDWAEYFDRIRKVCPWSKAAWNKGEIKITKWSGNILDMENNQAIVYVVKNANKRQLKKLCKRLDKNPKYDWLWSEPKYGNYASPLPVLIQQDSRKLFDARFSIGYYDDVIG